MTTEFIVVTAVDREWFRAIATVLRGRVESDRDEITTWLDTHDWRLHHAGLVLTHHDPLCADPPRADSGHDAHDGPRWLVRDRDGTRIAGLPAPSGPLEAVRGGLLELLPEGAVRDRIADAAGIRAVLPRAVAEGRSRALAVTGNEAKTVARVEVRVPVRVHGRDLGTLVRVEPVRGYTDRARDLTSLLHDLPSLAPATASLRERAHRAVGLTLGRYRSSPELDLTPDMPAGEVWATALGQLLEIVEDNLEGTRRDLDSEFLHDLRVAVRRSRTALRFARGVLPEQMRTDYRGELQWLGRQTSLPRDLDVYLLGLEEMTGHVTDPAALTPFAQRLREHRDRAHRDLEEALDSARFDRLVAGWRRDLAGTKGADTRVDEVATAALDAAVRRVRKRSRAITENSPPEALHDLRKRCKELRYLLDMLVGLDHHGDWRSVLPAVKKLQKSLGRHHDACSQTGMVVEYTRELRARRAPAATIAAMGELESHLHERSVSAGADVTSRLTHIDQHLDERKWRT